MFMPVLEMIEKCACALHNTVGEFCIPNGTSHNEESDIEMKSATQHGCVNCARPPKTHLVDIAFQMGI